MPVEFVHDAKDPKDAYKLLMAYDGSGRRISKTRYSKNVQYGYWTQDVVTHYTGIGTEVREAMRRSASPKTTVVVNLPQGLGRYLPEDAEKAAGTAIPLDKDGKPVFMGEATPEFEWYLKNHLGSTMLVYGTSAYSDPLVSGYKDGVKAAYDYRAFGEQVSLAEPADKVTENFTGKEKDDETQLNYFGARYLDPMLGLWTSVDPARQFLSPYLYVGNGMNPVNGVDGDGNKIVSTNSANNQKIADAMNKIASDQVTFYFDKNNELKFSYNEQFDGKGSITYAKTLAVLASIPQATFNISIDPSNKEIFKRGHGKTDANGNVILDGADHVTMGANGLPMYQSFAEILMHEIVSHVAPMIEAVDITPNSTHAIDDDNLIR